LYFPSFFHYQSIIHYSPANQSGEERPVINTFITHKNAGIEICYWDKIRQNEIEIFEQEADFMINFQNFGHDIFSRPSIGRSKGFVPFDFPKITVRLLQKEYGLPLAEEEEEKVPKQKTKFKTFLKKLFTKT